MTVDYYRNKIHSRISKGKKINLSEPGGILPQASYVLLEGPWVSHSFLHQWNVSLLHKRTCWRLGVQGFTPARSHRHSAQPQLPKLNIPRRTADVHYASYFCRNSAVGMVQRSVYKCPQFRFPGESQGPALQTGPSNTQASYANRLLNIHPCCHYLTPTHCLVVSCAINACCSIKFSQ